jgi:hypothetical protein
LTIETGLQRDAMGNAMKPRAKPLASMNRLSLSNQNQEGRLKRIFEILMLAEQSPTNAEDKRPIPADDYGERLLVAAIQEFFQEHRVVATIGFKGNSAKKLLQVTRVRLCHP